MITSEQQRMLDGLGSDIDTIFSRIKEKLDTLSRASVLSENEREHISAAMSQGREAASKTYAWRRSCKNWDLIGNEMDPKAPERLCHDIGSHLASAVAKLDAVVSGLGGKAEGRPVFNAMTNIACDQGKFSPGDRVDVPEGIAHELLMAGALEVVSGSVSLQKFDFQRSRDLIEKLRASLEEFSE